jgi:hypothetical protein
MKLLIISEIPSETLSAAAILTTKCIQKAACDPKIVPEAG